MWTREGTLVCSAIQGRFALDDAVEGRDLTSGDVAWIRMNGQWVAGRVEHSLKHHGGYYFWTEDDETYPLQAGMRVRLP